MGKYTLDLKMTNRCNIMTSLVIAMLSNRENDTFSGLVKKKTLVEDYSMEIHPRYKAKLTHADVPVW